MREIYKGNFGAAEPLTPLNPDEPIRYVRCNLTNRQVHADSVIERCQQAQVIVVGTGDDRVVHRVGRGVRGEVTASMVQVKRDQVEGQQ